MIQIRCPSCEKALKLAENLQGKQIRCPACKNVFRVAAPAVAEEVVPAPAPASVPKQAVKPRAPAPPPPVEEDPFAGEEVAPAPPPRSRRAPVDVEEAPPRRRPSRDDGFDFGEESGEEKRRRRSCKKASGSMLMAFLLNLIAFVVLAVMLFMGGALVGGGRGGSVVMSAIIIVLGIVAVIFLGPSIFIMIASSMLRSMRGKGLVITGAIMAFITSLELLAYFVLSLGSFLTVLEAIGRVGFGPVAVPLLHFLTVLLAMVFGIGAGIRGLIALGNYR